MWIDLHDMDTSGMPEEVFDISPEQAVLKQQTRASYAGNDVGDDVGDGVGDDVGVETDSVASDAVSARSAESDDPSDGATASSVVSHGGGEVPTPTTSSEPGLLHDSAKEGEWKVMRLDTPSFPEAGNGWKTLHTPTSTSDLLAADLPATNVLEVGPEPHMVTGGAKRSSRKTSAQPDMWGHSNLHASVAMIGIALVFGLMGSM